MSECVITIAIPVYNVETYVEKSLMSAINQNVSEKYEILIVDDCGSDSSMDVVSKIIEEHQKSNCVFRIVKHEMNMGLGEARNTAIKEASGKYLFFLDSDDWIAEDCLATLLCKMVRENADVVIGSVDCYDCKVKKQEKMMSYDDRIIESENAGLNALLNGIDLHIQAWNKLFRLDFLRTHNIYTIHRIMEDSVFDLKVRLNARKLCLVSDVTYVYNKRENSILTSIFRKDSSDESIDVYCDIVKKTRAIIEEKFADVWGVYDLYMQRVHDVLYSIGLSSQTSRQREQVMKSLNNCIDFVPSSSVLMTKKAKVRFHFLKWSPSCFYIIRRYRMFVLTIRFLRKCLTNR